MNVAHYQRPQLYQKQFEAIFCTERYGIVEASTKTGKTSGCIIWLLEQALQGEAGHNYWWVAPIFSQAKIAFRRLLRAMPRQLYTQNYSQLNVTLRGGQVIWFKGADNPDSLYGEDVYAAVIDEATRCKEEAWYGVRSTLTATNGPIRIIGNVKGRKNWAYKMARLAQGGAPGMHYAKLTIHDAVAAGIIPASEVEDARAALPASVFAELYLAEPSENAGNPFGGSDVIAACIRDALSTKPVVVWGIDLAKSTDWTVCIGLDAEGNVAQVERWQGPWETTIDKILKLCGSTPAIVDSTGVGDPVLEALQKRGRSVGAKFEGFKFSESSKQQLMERLALAIQHRAIGYPKGIIVDELDTFEFHYTRTGVRYSAPDGLTDDAVCALALSVVGHSALSSRTMRVWGGVQAPAPISELAAKQATDEQIEQARTAALDAINSSRWFGGDR